MPIHPYLLLPTPGTELADEWNRLGIAAHQQNNGPQAQAYYQRALSLDPRHAAACQNLAILFATNPATTNEASLAFERASMCDGKFSVIPANRAILSIDQERVDDAEVQGRKAIEIDPKDANALKILAMILTSAGKPDESIELYNRALDIDPKDSVSATNACFVQTLTRATPADLRRQRDRWYQAHKYEGVIAPHGNDKRTDRPLRVGYVGGDFKSHSAAFIFARVLLHHTEAVEMYLYSSLPVDAVNDMRTKAFKERAGDRWRDIAMLTDEQADALIRQDKIDILVDLAAHTQGGRLGIFCRKPAPVQVTAWGFAHGCGLGDKIDWFMADPIAVPPEDRAHFAEKIWDLPCIITFEEPTVYGLSGVSKPPVARNGHFSYGVFTRYEKLSDDALACYGKILARVPESKIIFKDSSCRRPDSMRRIYKSMPGISQDRILLMLSSDHAQHMRDYQLCDLFLNPFPHTSGTVSLEALYMGVPMLTRYGSQAGGRTAASVLSAIGRKEWIAYSDEEYIEKAVELADRTAELAAARKTIREDLVKSPVVAGYAESVESSYKHFWKEWCER